MSTTRPAIMQTQLQLCRVPLEITVNAYATTDANITAYSTNCPDVYIYKEGDTTTGVDADVAFGTLDTDADAGVFGLLLVTGDAARLHKCGLSDAASVSIYNVAGTLACTASAVVKKGGGTGVTPSGNIAVTFSTAGVDPDATTGTVVLQFDIEYWKTQPR